MCSRRTIRHWKKVYSLPKAINKEIITTILILFVIHIKNSDHVLMPPFSTLRFPISLPLQISCKKFPGPSFPAITLSTEKILIKQTLNLDTFTQIPLNGLNAGMICHSARFVLFSLCAEVY